MPQVTVIMNCLNGEKFLPEALASLAAQTFQDFEIVFWDNGSSDASARIASDYGPQLRYFRSDRTVSLGAARNLAIARARGEYIAFLDCDDLWRPRKLEKQIALMRSNPALGLVATDTEIVKDRKVLYRLFEQSQPARGMVFRELLERQWISMSSALLRKSAMDTTSLPDGAGTWFDESLNVCEEADLFYRIAHDYELDFVNEPLTVWRVHSDNTTFKKFGQVAAETIAILQRQRLMHPDFDSRYAGLAEFIERRAAFQLGIACWRAGENKKARETIAPYLDGSAKFRLFWLASFLPGSFFDIAGRLYFMLPQCLRK